MSFPVVVSHVYCEGSKHFGVIKERFHNVDYPVFNMFFAHWFSGALFLALVQAVVVAVGALSFRGARNSF
ncbi:hypothetical protein [Schaalia sp. JY-X169]|uniref:hypothetical protein n=1 Tax=Schaalia sp. JY-X169 TaxID=2758572 RepID=UPI002174D65A|nr:hypothetical protein [Schaalia sp. JY-X169]